MMIAYHATTPDAREKIINLGLNKGSYVTLDSVDTLSPSERVEKLCLDREEKGGCFCKIDIETFDIQIPQTGPSTCRGATQFQTTKKLAVNECLCESRGVEIFFGILAEVVLVGAALWLIKKSNISHSQYNSICSEI